MAVTDAFPVMGIEDAFVEAGLNLPEGWSFYALTNTSYMRPNWTAMAMGPTPESTKCPCCDRPRSPTRQVSTGTGETPAAALAALAVLLRAIEPLPVHPESRE